MNDKIRKNSKKIIAILVVIIMVSVIFSYEDLSNKNQKTTSFDCSTKLILDMGNRYPAKFFPAEYTNVYNCTLHAFSSTGSEKEYLNTTLSFIYVYFCQNGLYMFCPHITINYSYISPIFFSFSSFNLDNVSNPRVFIIPGKNNNSIIFPQHSKGTIFASIGSIRANGSYKKGMNLNFTCCLCGSNYTKIAETANYEIQIYLTQDLYTTYYISMKEVYANNNHEVFYHDL